MRTYTITIDMDNAAFEDGEGAEVANLLHDLARRCERTFSHAVERRLMDANGNTVGRAEVTTTPD